MDLAEVNRPRFLLRKLLEEQVRSLRQNAVARACREFLFGGERGTRVRVGSEYESAAGPPAAAERRVARPLNGGAELLVVALDPLDVIGLRQQDIDEQLQKRIRMRALG